MPQLMMGGVEFEIVHNPEGRDGSQVRWFSRTFQKQVSLFVSGTQLAVAAVKLDLNYTTELDQVAATLALAVENQEVQDSQLVHETDQIQLRFRDDDLSASIEGAFLQPWYVVSDYSSAIQFASRHLRSLLKGAAEDPQDIRVEGIDHQEWSKPWRVTFSYVDATTRQPPAPETIETIEAKPNLLSRASQGRDRSYCVLVVNKAGELVSFARER